jgi:hypothetical protein
MGLRQDGDAWVGEHAPHKVDGSLPETRSCGAADSEELG